jgi:phage major head subunit gpT-like protein
MFDMKWLDLQLFAAVPVQPTTGNTFYYTDADRDNEENFGKLLEPGLRRLFFETYDELPEQYSKIYNVHTSTKAKETEWGMGAFGDWTKRESQFDVVAYKTLSPGLERTYTHDAFTQGFMVTREMYDDDQYRMIEKFPKAMARAGRAKLEKDAMNPLIHGFVTNGHGVAGDTAIYDGQALFSNSHPLLDSTGVGDNLQTGALSDVNLKAALQLMREIPDEAGNLVQFKATRLIIPPALEDTARRLLHSALIPGSANNDTNEYLRSAGLEIVIMDYLGAAAGGSDTAWYLQDGSRHELNFFWRKRPEFAWEKSFDDFVAKYRGYMRYSYGISDWRGLIGSTGL